ncbi:MAG: tetratricopeptide repeat protein [Alphaproteobacteria bacterium]
MAAMERISEIDPADEDARFNLAYAHSLRSDEDLALFHYLQIPANRRNAATWNNLGAVFDHFEAPANAVTAYRTSEEMGETLAMSNLAFKFLKAGFLKEAKEECARAVNIEEFHRNIGAALERLGDISEEEQQAIDKVVSEAKSKSSFFQKFGAATVRTEMGDVSRRAQGPHCELHLQINGKKFLATGTYERPRGGVLGALLAGPSTHKRPTERISVKYEGTIEGKAAHAKVHKESAEAIDTILGTNSEVTALLIYCCDGSQAKTSLASKMRTRWEG